MSFLPIYLKRSEFTVAVFGGLRFPPHRPAYCWANRPLGQLCCAGCQRCQQRHHAPLGRKCDQDKVRSIGKVICPADIWEMWLTSLCARDGNLPAGLKRSSASCGKCLPDPGSASENQA